MSITINGLPDLIKRFNEFPDKIKQEIKEELQASGLTIVRNAQARAPYNTGLLSRRISTYSSGELQQTIVAATKYSAYQEFGTGTLTSIPAGYELLAAEFQGEGKKNINIAPHPFLINSYEDELPQLIERINNIIIEALNG